MKTAKKRLIALIIGAVATAGASTGLYMAMQNTPQETPIVDEIVDTTEIDNSVETVETVEPQQNIEASSAPTPTPTPAPTPVTRTQAPAATPAEQPEPQPDATTEQTPPTPTCHEIATPVYNEFKQRVAELRQQFNATAEAWARNQAATAGGGDGYVEAYKAQYIQEHEHELKTAQNDIRVDSYKKIYDNWVWRARACSSRGVMHEYDWFL